MLNKPETLAFYRTRLPHWVVADGVYFVTISAHGAIPQKAAYKIHQEIESLKHLRGGDLLERKRIILREIEDWLDRQESVSYLALPAVAQMIEESILHREKEGIWQVFEYVIMPSHLHLLIAPLQEDLLKILKQFKTWTSHQGNMLLKRRGAFWGRDWFDHWMRSPEEGERVAHYIQNNPVKAGLVEKFEQWPYGGWARHSNSK